MAKPRTKSAAEPRRQVDAPATEAQVPATATAAPAAAKSTAPPPSWNGRDGRVPAFIPEDRRFLIQDAEGQPIAVPLGPAWQAQLRRIANGRQFRGGLAAHGVAVATRCAIEDLELSMRFVAVVLEEKADFNEMQQRDRDNGAPDRCMSLVQAACSIRHLLQAARRIDPNYWSRDFQPEDSGGHPGGRPPGPSCPAWGAYALQGVRTDAGALGTFESAHGVVAHVLDHFDNAIRVGMHQGDLLRVEETFEEAIRGKPGLDWNVRLQKYVRRRGDKRLCLGDRVRAAADLIRQQAEREREWWREERGFDRAHWLDVVLPSRLCAPAWAGLDRLLSIEVAMLPRPEMTVTFDDAENGRPDLGLPRCPPTTLYRWIADNRTKLGIPSDAKAGRLNTYPLLLEGLLDLHKRNRGSRRSRATATPPQAE